MATKSITITNEAYERLAIIKGNKESFSDVINKITRKYSFLDIIGIFSNKEADEIEANIKDIRRRIKKEMHKIDI